MGRLKTSAAAAAKSCSGGASGTQCGLRWTRQAWDGANDPLNGVGEQMSGLEVMQSLLAPTVAGPVTAGSGGTSQGDANAGTARTTIVAPDAITTADKAGAGILTAMVLTTLASGAWWMAA